MKQAKHVKRKAEKAHGRQNTRSGKAGRLPLLSQEFLKRREDDAEALLGLERMLIRGQGFAIAFARVNKPSRRAELVKEIHARIEPQGIRIVEIDLREPVRDLLAEIRRRLKNTYLSKPRHEKREFVIADSASRFAIFVYGLEHSLPSSETYHPTLAVMNYKRENFRDLIPAPIVLWVPEYALQAIMEGAPDFWAWRSGVFEFATPQAEVEKTWLEVKPESGQLELSRMTEDEKRQRIRLLSGLLAEYEARIDADSYELSTIRLDLFNRLGGLHYFLGELGHALRFYERAQELAQKLNHQHSLAISKNNIGLIHQDRGNYDAALVEFENSLKIQEELGDLGGIASSLNQIGIIHHFSKDYDTALANYNKSIRTYEEIGDHYAVAGVVHNIGLINQERGNYEAALADFERCLQISEQVGDRRKVANLIHNIGLTHQARGDYDAALTEFEKSLKIAEELGDRVTIAASLHHIGMVYHYQGDYAAALAAYGKSLKIEEQLGNRAGTASARTQIGKLFAQSGRCLEAFENLLFSLNTFTELQSPKTAIAVSLLRDLRSVWGAENFDTAWQQATGKPVPEFLISENSN